MRVGIISYDFYPPIGGQGVYVYEIYRRLLEQGVTPVVFSSRESDIENSIYIRCPNNIVFSVKVNYEINKWIKQYSLSLVHFQGGPGGVILLKNPGIPLVFTAHHVYSQQYQFLRKSVYKPLMSLEKLGYSLSDAIISVSTTTKEALINNYAIPPEKIEIIPNGVDAQIFRPLGLERITDSLLYVGRLHERKGLLYLIEAMCLLKKECPTIRLYLIGSGGLQSELQERIREGELEDNVIFLGNVSREDLVRWYNRVQIFVLPSLFEGFGIVCIEAMACGTTVIGTRVPGITDIISDHNNGILVPAQNSQRLAATISQLLKNARLRQNLGGKGREDIVARFNWDDITKKIVKIYENALVNRKQLVTLV